MNKDRDAELVADCQHGDRQALASLVRRYERPLYNAAFRMLGNPDDAADVTQTTFLKALDNIDRFNPEFRFFSWIYRIALNEAINQLNRRSRLESLDEAPVSPGPRPEEAVAAERLGGAMQAALMEVHEDHRAVIVLRYFSECSYSEIGHILRIPDKTVKSRLFSARQQLRARLEQRGIASA